MANQFGWFAAEVGRQPWIVQGLLRTSEGLSAVVTANTVLISLVLFTFIYLLLFAVFVYLLNDKIQHGPDDTDLTCTDKIARPIDDKAMNTFGQSRSQRNLVRSHRRAVHRLRHARWV